MKTYTSPTIELLGGGGGHEVDKPIWFYYVVAVTVVVVAAVAIAVCWTVMPPEPGTKVESF